MGREAWQAMSVYFIPPTGNFEVCIDEAMGGKDGLEAQLQPKWAGSLSRSYITKAFSRVQGDVAGSPACGHTGLCFYATRVQQKALGKWSGKGLLQSWLFAWELMSTLGLSFEAMVRVAVRAQVARTDE